jgi:EpsI family protein
MLLGITACLVKLFEFPEFKIAEASNVFDKIPLEIGKWKGNRSVLDEKIYKILETDSVFVSRYGNSNESVTLSIVYYPQLKVDFHKPEYCNTGKGDIVENLGKRIIYLNQGGIKNHIPTTAFLVRRNNKQTDLYCYFYKTGHYIYRDYFWMRYRMAIRYLNEKTTDASLTIVSVENISDVEKAFNILDNFIGDIFPVLI